MPFPAVSGLSLPSSQPALLCRFLYIKDHGIPSSILDKVFAAGHEFLALPTEAKQEHVWIPDRYLGWRSQADLKSVTGAAESCVCQMYGEGFQGLGFRASSK